MPSQLEAVLDNTVPSEPFSTIPAKLVLVEVEEVIMVQLRITLESAFATKCTPTPFEPVPVASIMRLLKVMCCALESLITAFSFVFVELKAILLPLPLKVMVLTSEELKIESNLNCSLYGPDPATTSNTTGPPMPQLIAAFAVLNVWKLPPVTPGT